ncbi:hypothetical protein L208DRAFT_1353806 [Tricholoma matsutake]|nr:hypothetical protein L208DRAFT_1353806 [Tricholoma matsutake 945]
MSIEGTHSVLPARSRAYDEFLPPFDPSHNAFDFHVYYVPSNESELKFAQKLYENVRREFPELRFGRFWDKPVGPHPTAMFEIDTFTPHQTGALFGWLAVNRGPCSVFIHPNTGDAYRDHTELLSWMGKPWVLDTDFLKQF